MIISSSSMTAAILEYMLGVKRRGRLIVSIDVESGIVGDLTTCTLGRPWSPPPSEHVSHIKKHPRKAPLKASGCAWPSPDGWTSTTHLAPRQYLFMRPPSNYFSDSRFRPHTNRNLLSSASALRNQRKLFHKGSFGQADIRRDPQLRQPKAQTFALSNG